MPAAALSLVALVVQDRPPCAPRPATRPRARPPCGRGSGWRCGARAAGLPPGLRPSPRAPRLRPPSSRSACTAWTRRARPSSGRGGFLRDTPGSEALGIGYAAALLRAATRARSTPASCFDAIGTMADRLARAGLRGAECQGRDAGGAPRRGGQLRREAGELEQEGRTRICYDGEAFRRVLALGGTSGGEAPGGARADAAGVHRPGAAPGGAQAVDEWRGAVLEQVDSAQLPAWQANRLHLRRAEVLRRRWPSSGRAEARRQRGRRRASAPWTSWRAVLKAELAEEDRSAYAVAAVRVAASRWASVPAPEAARALDLASS